MKEKTADILLEEKEKKAIENLKGEYWYVGEEGLEASIKIVLNLVESLIAENKELKDSNIELATTIDALHTDISELKTENKKLKDEDNYMPKSKVEEKIKQLKKKGNSVGIPHLYGAEIELLQSLLGKE